MDIGYMDLGITLERKLHDMFSVNNIDYSTTRLWNWTVEWIMEKI